jgi:hypothetical protein
MSDDLSDESFWECTDGMTRLQSWQECRRRAEAQIDVFRTLLKEWLRKSPNIDVIGKLRDDTARLITRRKK